MTRLRTWGGSLTFQVLLIAITSRLAMLWSNWFTLEILTPNTRGYQKEWDLLMKPGNPLDGWSRWDAAHYVRVVWEGYDGPSGVPVQPRGFFPLYPMLIRAFSWLQPGDVTRNDLAQWGVIAANVCFLIMIVWMAKLFELNYGRDVALTTTTLFLVSPMAFFLNAGYSESLFLLCTVAAFWFAYKQKWLPAGVAIMFASATRLFGLAIIPCILLIAWRHRARILDMAYIAVIGSVGAASYVLWTWIKYDDAMAYWHAQNTFWNHWDVRVGQYWDMLTSSPRDMIATPENTIILVNVVLAVIAIATLPWVWKLVEPGMALFTTIIVLFHAAYTWHSLGRYLLTAIGVYIVLGILLSKPGWNGAPRTAVFVASAILLATLNMHFAVGFWIV